MGTGAQSRRPLESHEAVPTSQTLQPAPWPEPPDRRGRVRQLIFGRALATHQHSLSLLPKFLALPVFSSDAISSVAYATQQIILALGASGLYLLQFQPEYTKNTLIIAGLIVLLLVIVVFSYWQTIFAYPKGGGSYIVTKDN